MYRRNCGKAPRLPLARERFTARDDEHSDFDGNGCCDGFTPHFPHPHPRAGVPALLAQGSVFIYFVMPDRPLYYSATGRACQAHFGKNLQISITFLARAHRIIAGRGISPTHTRRNGYEQQLSWRDLWQRQQLLLDHHYCPHRSLLLLQLRTALFAQSNRPEQSGRFSPDCTARSM